MRLLLLIALLPITGCGDTSTPPEPSPGEREVFELMSRLSFDAANEAYARLEGFAYTARIVVEELDDDGEPTASASRTLRRIPQADGVEETVLEADSSGAFSGASPIEGQLRPDNPLSFVLPGEPPYANMRTRDRYAYEMRPDTMVDGRRLRVAQATLHRESANEQPIRYARYYLDDSNAVVGVDVLRLTASVLFDEISHVTVWLQTGPDGGFFPGTALSATTIHTPGNEPRRLRLRHTFRDITANE